MDTIMLFLTMRCSEPGGALRLPIGAFRVPGREAWVVRPLVVMKRNLPLILITVGVSLLISGFFYDFIFAGIPYQDPTPEMSARYAFHSRVASTIYTISGGAVLFGAVIGVIRVIIRRSSQ